ncbi:hypothetical protein HAX54_048911, partial [Datura stramonium]|nr:hypothetical protein [Datura stramonium]
FWRSFQKGTSTQVKLSTRRLGALSSMTRSLIIQIPKSSSEGLRQLLFTNQILRVQLRDSEQGLPS